MKYSIAVLGVLSVWSLGLVYPAFADVTPTLTLAPTGVGDNVQINVTGDPNVSVTLSYAQDNSPSQSIALGSTNSSGQFTTTLSSGSYGLTAGMLVSVILNGNGGPQSPIVTWPISTLTLSQNTVVVDAGSFVNVSAANMSTTGALYVSTNSSPSVARVNAQGNNLQVEGVTAGSTNLTVCEDNNAAPCQSLYVLVVPENAAQLSFSFNNVSIMTGQNLPITMTGGNGLYEIYKNSNPSVIQASINGAVLTLSTTASIGSSSIIICSTDMSSCGVVIATAGNVSTSTITFSSDTPSIPVGETTGITVSDPTGTSFYISSNSNAGVIQASLSGSTVTLTGLSSGSSSITVCSSTTNCGSITVTVPSTSGSTTNTTTSTFAMSQTSLSLTVGQNVGISLTGDGNYTVSSNTNPNVAAVFLEGSTLTVTGGSPGLTSVTVCQDTNVCQVLSVVVSNATEVTTTTPVTTAPSTSVSTTLPAGCTSGTGYSATSGVSCATGTTAPTTTPTPTPTPSTTVTFTQYLSPGSTGTQVTALQNILIQQGLLSAEATGYYGIETENAVIQLQKTYDINPLGVVGPATRALLNQIESGSSSSSLPTSSIDSMSLSELRTEMQTLQSELSQVLSRIAQL
jgi:hypothetical protein